MTRTHCDISVQFEIGHMLLEAVGFLEPGETKIPGEEALRRVDNGHLITTEVEWHYIYECRGRMPLQLMRYFLYTAWAGPEHPNGMLGLFCGDHGWTDTMRARGVFWSEHALILRHCTRSRRKSGDD